MNVNIKTITPLPNMNKPSKSRLALYLPYLIISALILVLFLVFFWSFIFKTIKPGEVGILYKRFGQGTITDKTYPEGLTLILPWDILYIYNGRTQQHEHKMMAISNEGLNVEVNMSIRYNPELETLGILHQNIGPDYLQKIIIPEVESNIREQFGRLDINNIYSPNPALLEDIVDLTKNKLQRNYITLQNVAILRITLPKNIEVVMEKKVEYKVLAEAYEFRIQAELLEVKRKTAEANGIKAFNDIVNNSLTDDILKWQGIQATIAISNSNNSKVVIIGNKSKEMPIILGGDSDTAKR